ncbi:unnamed protein product [Zymoseptoria tritici ST99CH_1A5]|uniref:Uncharacterized protein n=1 Tax=Zymoseptoria tritici ST99CH_1A5 TaxID=1276529 RepID=A0A1Y6LQS4_ZYMTR|nr:unnamed protein product [Zymoseptoria tritici ST99CH_1A5]
MLLNCIKDEHKERWLHMFTSGGDFEGIEVFDTASTHYIAHDIDDDAGGAPQAYRLTVREATHDIKQAMYDIKVGLERRNASYDKKARTWKRWIDTLNHMAGLVRKEAAKLAMREHFDQELPDKTPPPQLTQRPLDKGFPLSQFCVKLEPIEGRPCIDLTLESTDSAAPTTPLEPAPAALLLTKKKRPARKKKEAAATAGSSTTTTKTTVKKKKTVTTTVTTTTTTIDPYQPPPSAQGGQHNPEARPSTVIGLPKKRRKVGATAAMAPASEGSIDTADTTQ